MASMITKILIAVSALISSSSLCYSAILQEPQEPMNGSSNKYRTLYLFSKPEMAHNQSLSLPKAQEKSLPVDAVKTSAPPQTHLGGLSAHYEKASLESVQLILQKYKTIPGGVTLEGIAKGIPEIQDISYNPAQNVFILNKGLIYQNPLSRSQMKEILLVIDHHTLMGVSLGDKDLVYGALEEGSLPTIYLKLADHFLGCIAFANNSWTVSHNFPEGYKPKPYDGPGNYYAVYFNFADYHFSIENNEILSKGSHMTATLIPLTLRQDQKGNYIPDYARITEGNFPEEYENNLKHIATQIAHYERDSRISKVNSYGQAAAFARFLKKNNLSLTDLAEQM